MPPKHLLLVAAPRWGHLRPLCVLAGRLASSASDDFVITIPTTPNYIAKVRDEVAAQFTEGDQAKNFQRIRIMSIFSLATMPQDPFALLAAFSESLKPVYQTLADGKPLTCNETSIVFDATPAPSVVIMDLSCYPALLAIRQIETEKGTKTPVLSWLTSGASSSYRYYAPRSMGGMGLFHGEIEKTAEKLGITAQEAGDKLVYHTEGRVYELPGLPPMYDYEFYPQQLPFAMPLGLILSGAYRFMKESDGVIIATSDAYEKDALAGFRKWVDTELKTPLYAVGPVLRSGYSTSSPGLSGFEPFSSFLDEKHSLFGEKSVLFMSFGSIFWPLHTAYIEEVLEALIEKNFPFVFCMASPFANLTPEIEEKVKHSGVGLLTKWSPQQYILNHPATGWFLTHGGHGSITESLASGVPLICWPFDTDQPTAAVHVTQVLKAGFELIQVRTGDSGLKPLHPSRGVKAPQGTREAVREEIREIIDAARGEEGKARRANAEKLQMEFGKAWEVGGTAEKQLRAFLMAFVR